MAKKYTVGTAPREAWWNQQQPRTKSFEKLAFPEHHDAYAAFPDGLPTGGGRPSMKRKNR